MLRDDIQQLIALVESQKFLEAIERFYSTEATMQENLSPPRVGLEALLENERKVLAGVSEWHICHAESYVADGDRASIHWIFDMTDKLGNRRHIDEIAYQQWKDGKIIEERFFYNPS